MVTTRKQNSRLDQQKSRRLLGRYQHDGCFVPWRLGDRGVSELREYWHPHFFVDLCSIAPPEDLSSVYSLGLYQKCARHMLELFDLSLFKHDHNSILAVLYRLGVISHIPIKEEVPIANSNSKAS
jgi:hypothetical protein